MERKRVKTVKDLSHKLGVSLKTLYKHKNEGLPQEPDGSFNIAKVRKFLIGQASVGKAGSSRSKTAKDYDEEYRRWKAAKMKLEYQTKSGELVYADQVKDAAFKTARHVRDALTQIPARVGPILAAENDQKKVYQLLNTEIRLALESLASNHPK